MQAMPGGRGRAFTGPLRLCRYTVMATIFNVLDYGAKGDATTNDTHAIQRAINAAAEAGGGEVYLPKGTYIVSGANVDGACLTLRSHVTLAGAGQSFTALSLANGSAEDIDGIVRTSASNDTLGASVQNLTIDGNSSRTSGTVHGLVSGNEADLEAHTRDLAVSGVIFYQCSGDGLLVSGQTLGLNVQDSVALGNGGDGFATRLISTPFDHTGGPAFNDNTAAQNGGDGFDLHIAGADLYNNNALNNIGNGIVLEKIPDALRSAQGSLEYGVVAGNGGAGIVDRLLIPYFIGVAIHDNGGAGILLEGTAGAYIQNNVLANNLQAGVQGANAGEIQATDYVDAAGKPHAADNRLHISGNSLTGGSNATVGISETGNAAREFHTIHDNTLSGFDSAGSGVGTTAYNSSAPNRLYGTKADDTLGGATGAMALFGLGGNDTLSGGARGDRLDGGAGGDTLTGGAGRDTFVFEKASDSHRSGSAQTFDVITDLLPQSDRLDLTALGLYGIGNGLNGTVALSYNADSNLTYLRSLETSGPSQSFQVALAGDYRGLLGSHEFTASDQGSAGTDTLNDSARTADLVLRGEGSNDRLVGGSGNDRLYGGAGADVLIGNAGADHFIYQQVSDSFVNDRTGVSEADTIRDFGPYDDPDHDSIGRMDRIDLTALGYTALGDGHNGTLKFTPEASGGYLLQSLHAEADGSRFALRIEGPELDSAERSDLPNAFYFAPSAHVQGVPQQIVGTDTNNWLVGFSEPDVIVGKGGNDAIEGGGGNDVLDGGTGRDELTGGSGADTFRFTHVADSYRGANDVITDFLPAKDVLDLSALGFTGFGDGTDGTVKITFSNDTGRSYIKSLDVDADGHRFEITALGDLVGLLGSGNFVFAHPVQTLIGAVEMEGMHGA
ncbi:hypothetical protein G7016_08630 [Pseudomonas japonica]|nr:hypothetical protein [Pseudomonas japonica]